MSGNSKKTGLAARVRAAMQKRRKPFTPMQISKALGASPGPEREAVARVLGDFYRRGEVERVGQSGKGFLYRYNRAYQSPEPPADLKRKVLKAIYVHERGKAFTTADVLKRTGDASQNYIQKILRDLTDAGLVELLGEKKRELSYGLENVYRVTDHDRFRRELL